MPIHPDFRFLRHQTIKILMVIDQGGSFGPVNFGLSEVLKALSHMPSWARVEVTRAHRAVDTFPFDSLPADEQALLSPTYQGFRFTQEGLDLSAFHEVWLFGVERSAALSPFPTHPLSNEELLALVQFMNAGGGVFATGDHEDLGYALCGRVPRVRSMRKWYWSTSSANGPALDGASVQLRAPDGETANRYDTLREGDPGWQFEDQSDTLPQPIEPVTHTVQARPWRITYPHPLLCGPRGMIRVLPDHPHEGECVVPTDLAQRFEIPGVAIDEYPADTSGHRVAPELVARGTVIAGHETPRPGGLGTPKPPVVGRTFGVIAAYDGHRANVGRVSVDSTWHHFFNINLKGDPGAPTAEKRTGFPATPAGQRALEDIQAYYRNIAVWLAPPAAQHGMMSAAIWNARWSSVIVEGVHPQTDFVLTATYARDALGRLATRCQTRTFIYQIARDLGLIRTLLEWPPRPVPPDPPDPWIDPAVVEDHILGGAMQELLKIDVVREKVDAEHITAALRKGAARGAKALRAHVESQVRMLKGDLDRLQTLHAKMDVSARDLAAD